MNAHVRVGIVRQRVVQPYVRLAQHLQPSVKRSPSAPSQPDPGGRNAASPEGPSLTPGIARFTGAKASVSTGDRPLTRAILRRHGLAVKRPIALKTSVTEREGVASKAVLPNH